VPWPVQAVREGAGDRAADLIGHLKKGEMAKEAERLLADTGWLPEPLRRVLPDVGADVDTASGSEGEDLPDFLAGEDDAPAEDEDETQQSVAAE
jgi:ParB family chromosome partitioning protein